MNRWSFGAAAAALVAIGCANPLDEDVGSGSNALIDSFPAEDLHAVVYLTNDTDSGFGACSGTIIAPRVVLTARHCVANGDGDGVTGAENVTVHTGPAYWEEEDAYDVLEIRAAEGRWDWDEELSEDSFMTSFRFTDLAVLVLAERARQEPLPVDFGPINPLVAQKVYIVGYGRTPFDGAGIKRRGEAWVLETLEDRGIATDGISCPGDSGGPLMDEAGTVRAVVSGGLSCDRERTNTSWFVAVPDFRDLVQGALDDAAGCGPHEMDDDCVVDAPVEPTPELPPAPPPSSDRAGCSATGAGAGAWPIAALLACLLAGSRRRRIG